MVEEMAHEVDNSATLDYEWDGSPSESKNNGHLANSEEEDIRENSHEDNRQEHDAGPMEMEAEPVQRNDPSPAHSESRAPAPEERKPQSASRPDSVENTFPFTNLYRVKTPMRFVKTRSNSGRPGSALSNGSDLQLTRELSTPSTMMSDDPRRLLDVKLSRRRAEEDFQLMQNRVKRLRLEEERAKKNIEDIRKRAEEIIRLKAQNELRARAKEHARLLKEQQLAEETAQRALAHAQLHASIRASRVGLMQSKAQQVQQCRQDRLLTAQRAWEARREEEERAARLKQDIYRGERLAVQRKYRNKHLQQMRAVQSYEQRIVENEKRRLEREAEIQRMEQEEAELLARLKQAQLVQQACYTELEMALEV